MKGSPECKSLKIRGEETLGVLQACPFPGYKVEFSLLLGVILLVLKGKITNDGGAE